MLVTPGQYHYMVSIEEMIQHSQDKTALHKMVLCEKHNNEQMVYYCNTCNVSYNCKYLIYAYIFVLSYYFVLIYAVLFFPNF